MKDTFKSLIITYCRTYIEKKSENYDEQYQLLKDALANETKSSAGDKHETGRAMVQLEMEKMANQIKEINNSMLTLKQIEAKKPIEKVTLGSLVETNLGYYFIGLSLGFLTISNEKVFAVSLASPIGKLLIGRQKGDQFSFNSQKITIKNIR